MLKNEVLQHVSLKNKN